jgi:hypothetical protein
MSIINNSIIAGASGQAGGAAAGYEIERSLRFSSGDSSYLSRTPSSAGNQTTWTWSGWVKRSSFDTTNNFFVAGTSAFANIRFANQNIDFTAYNGSSYIGRKVTSAVYRDPSAWYHIVCVFDTSNATAADRMRVYVNGVREESFSTSTDPTQNATSVINSNVEHRVGTFDGSTEFFNGYLADVHFVDGRGLDPTDFGEFDDNGVWQPIEYTSTFAAPVTQTPALDGAMIIKADGASMIGAVAGTGSKCLYTSSDGINWTFQNREAFGPFQTYAKYLAIGAADTNDITFIPGNGESFTYAMYSATTDFTTQGDITVDTTSLSYSAGGTTSYGTNGFHLDFADNSSDAALGYDAAGSNDWTVNNISAVQASYSSDLVALYGLTDPKNAFDGSTSTRARDQDGTVNVTRNPPYTLEFIPSTPIPFSSQVRVFTGLNPGSPYNGKIYVDTGSGYGSAITPVQSTWQTIVSGSGSLHKIKCTGDQNEANLNAVEIDGVVLVDSETDSLRDSPTNGNTANDTGAGGEVPGNYATWNPLAVSAYPMSFTNGNLDTVSGGQTQWKDGWATISPTAGKWYWEYTVNASSGTEGTVVGLATLDAEYHNSNNYIYARRANGGKLDNGTYTASVFTAVSDGDIVGFAYDADAQKLWTSLNGTFVGNPAAGTGESWSSIPANVFPYVSTYNDTTTANFGQRPFANTNVPSGYKALCTANLDDPTIADGSTAMDVALYTGNGSTQTISGLNFSPDFVWIKQRSGTQFHRLQDTVRGTSKVLYSNVTDPEDTTSNDITAFNSDGFSVGSFVNTSSATYAAWTWDGGSSTVSNTDGSITSSVRANASAGFSIVTYTGNGTGGATVGHGLGATPEMIIVKQRSSSTVNKNWVVYHAALGNTKGLLLNQSAAQAATIDFWNDSGPSSSTFTLGPGDDAYSSQTNVDTKDYVAYCFAPIEGYSAFGSYTGNGSSTNFVHLGFRPRFVMVKRTDSANGWFISDSARGSYNVLSANLRADSSSDESSIGTIPQDFVSNGFVLKDNSGAQNTLNGTYIYAAFAEHPFRSSRAR